MVYELTQRSNFPSSTLHGRYRPENSPNLAQFGPKFGLPNWVRDHLRALPAGEQTRFREKFLDERTPRNPVHALAHLRQRGVALRAV